MPRTKRRCELSTCARGEKLLALVDQLLALSLLPPIALYVFPGPIGVPPTAAVIRCAYHAWRFDADGKCLSIPQSDSGGRDEAQPKACAKVYPTQVLVCKNTHKRMA